MPPAFASASNSYRPNVPNAATGPVDEGVPYGIVNGSQEGDSTGVVCWNCVGAASESILEAGDSLSSGAAADGFTGMGWSRGVMARSMSRITHEIDVMQYRNCAERMQRKRARPPFE
jgi:hypothetical protein